MRKITIILGMFALAALAFAGIEKNRLDDIRNRMDQYKKEVRKTLVSPDVSRTLKGSFCDIKQRDALLTDAQALAAREEVLAEEYSYSRQLR